jgi:hypothetical protein
LGSSPPLLFRRLAANEPDNYYASVKTIFVLKKKSLDMLIYEADNSNSKKNEFVKII